MKKKSCFLSLIILLVFGCNVTAQVVDAPSINPKMEEKYKDIKDSIKVYDKVEVDPKYNGDWAKFLQKYFKHPNVDDEGLVIINFIVEKNGELSEIIIDAKSPQKNIKLVNECIRMLKKSSGNWLPGLQNGEIIRTRHQEKFKFVN
jgi:hypothetical protein